MAGLLAGTGAGLGVSEALRVYQANLVLEEQYRSPEQARYMAASRLPSKPSPERGEGDEVTILRREVPTTAISPIGFVSLGTSVTGSMGLLNWGYSRGAPIVYYQNSEGRVVKWCIPQEDGSTFCHDR